MEELFRFSVVRPISISKPATITLQRSKDPIQSDVTKIKSMATTLEDQLRESIQSLDPSTAPSAIWVHLEPIALNYLLSKASSILNNSLWKDLEDFLTALLSLTPDSLSPSKWPVSEWKQNGQTNVLNLVNVFNSGDVNSQNTLRNYLLDLGDIFVALLIVRRGGPANIEKLIRSKTPPIWNASKLLHSSPTLKEISDHINLIDLILAGPNALSVPSDLTNAVDIQAYILKAFNKAINKTLLLPEGILAYLQKPIHGVGFREFNIVKQHIRGYQLGEIAKIENILKGESRDHSTKHTLSKQTDTFSQTISTTETDKELDNTDHTDIQNEVQNQVKEDTKLDAGVHASYDGGSYKLQADLSVSYDKSSEETKKFSSDVSKDVTQKAVTKVIQQITQSQTTIITETFEEDESQSFDNKIGSANISGVYQWVEKVYLAQTFNLGKHLLIDLMVPEPAANLLALATIPPSNQNIPVKPDPLGSVKGTLSVVAPLSGAGGTPKGEFIPTLDSNKNKILDKPLQPDDLKTMSDVNYWVGKFQVTGVEQPPPQVITVSDSLSVDARDGTQGDVKENKTLTIPDGYYADTVNMAAAWYSANKGDVDQQITIMVGDYNFNFGTQASDPAVLNTGIWNNNYSGRINGARLANDQSIQGQISVAVKSVNDDQVTLSLEIVCKASDELNNKWRLQAYEKIVSAWQKLESDYETKIAGIQLQNPTVGPLGAADPDANRLIERVELKRSCIAIIDNNNSTVRGVGGAVSVQDFPATIPKDTNDPNYPQLPEPDLTVTQEIGSRVRWFEQAFEWENMAYILYPYYWGRRSTWIQNLNLKNDDPLFLNFLQAGYARVVVPVRLGFEWAVHFYLQTGLPWLGGGLPPIGDNSQNPLYLDIAEELKDLTGGNNQELELPIDEKPWNIKIPTTLIKLETDDKLPSWNRLGLDGKPDSQNYPSDPPIGPWTWSEQNPPQTIGYTN
jgi:hypothetical protein